MHKCRFCELRERFPGPAFTALIKVGFLSMIEFNFTPEEIESLQSVAKYYG